MSRTVQLRVRLNGVPCELLVKYRLLRKDGWSRHDANMICIGMAGVVAPGSISVARIQAAVQGDTP